MKYRFRNLGLNEKYTKLLNHIESCEKLAQQVHSETSESTESDADRVQGSYETLLTQQRYITEQYENALYLALTDLDHKPLVSDPQDNPNGNHGPLRTQGM